ncbi:MAG: hypothetical protein V1776_04600 [Candidatus Diapherotrites archaeon]
MIEFTLSKINLLILVIALFSIISFFTLNVGKIFLVGEVRQELEKYSLTLNGMVIAPTTCDSKPFAIPSKYSSFGNNVYYTLHISKAQTSLENRLIFTVSDVRSPNNVLAASSLSTNAEIVVYDLIGGTVVPLADLEELVLDPQSVPPRNAFYVVKSVTEGKETLHIFPCAITSSSQTCFGSGSIKEQVSNYLVLNGGNNFIC